MKYLILFLVFIFSCTQEQIHPALKTSIPKQVSLRSEISEKLYSNPALVFGSSFGNYFQSLYRIGRYDDLVKLTCMSSRKKYGDEKLRQFYEHVFHFDFQLGKLTAIKKSGDTINLIYSKAIILGTKRKITIPVIIQNDSCFIVISSLKTPFPYLQ